MTEARSPRERQALALFEDERFCEWLDATAAHASHWPHNRTTAAARLREQLCVESLGHLAISLGAAQAFDEVDHRFASWERNQELGT